MIPGEMVYSYGDAHIYEEHVSIFKEQLTRVPKQFPQYRIDKEIKSLEDILAFNCVDLLIDDYAPDPSIKAPMIA